jgi:hypothetical protein
MFGWDEQITVAQGENEIENASQATDWASLRMPTVCTLHKSFAKKA